MDSESLSQSESTTVTKNALSLDDVFVLTARSPEHAKKRKLPLTPLSKKACLIHGIDPHVLRQREYASFTQKGQDPEVTTMKYEVYQRTREKLYDVASEERAKLKAKADRSMSCSFSTTDSASMATSVDKEQEISTLIENEKRRLEKVANRQQKELMRMLAFEHKSKEIIEKMHAKTEEQARKEEQRKKEKRKRDLQASENARLRELRRKAREEAEVSLQRLKMQEQFERERKLRENKVREDKEMKKRAAVEEEAAKRKREAHRLQTKKIFDAQRLETEKKMQERDAKEREREAKLELKRLVDAQVAEAKRKEAAHRIESNLRAAKDAQEFKRNELLDKQARHEEFLDVIMKEKQAEREEKHHKSQIQNRKRQSQLRRTKQKEEEAKRGVLTKIEQEERHLKELKDQRLKEQMLIKAEKDLQLQMKRDNQERIKKAHEYHLKEMTRKADENDKRCQDLKRKKEDLLKLRRKNMCEAKVKKDRLVARLDSSRTGGPAQIRKLLNELSLDVSLASNS